MRVIRTELYFNQTQVRELENEINPGIGIAFFGIKQPNTLSPSMFSNSFANYQVYHFDEHIVSNFLDFAIRGVELPDGLQESHLTIHENVNYQIAEAVFRSDIVVERSPPSGIPFGELAKRSAAIGVGSFIGYGLAAGSFPLMIITVPLGIIVVGAAVGVSRGLENGLDKAIQRLINGEPVIPPRAKRKR